MYHGRCKECRFYDGKDCAAAKPARVPNFTCGNWVSYTVPNVGAVRQCKAAGFMMEGVVLLLTGRELPISLVRIGLRTGRED
jgi:hypothetical protein